MTSEEQHVLAVTTIVATLQWIKRETRGLSRPAYAPMVYINYAHQDALEVAAMQEGDFDDSKPWHHN